MPAPVVIAPAVVAPRSCVPADRFANPFPEIFPWEPADAQQKPAVKINLIRT
jgi:hypothetical protein